MDARVWREERAFKVFESRALWLVFFCIVSYFLRRITSTDVKKKHPVCWEKEAQCNTKYGFCLFASVSTGFVPHFLLQVCACVRECALKHTCTHRQAHWGPFFPLLKSVKKEKRKRWGGGMDRKREMYGIFKSTHKPVLKGNIKSTCNSMYHVFTIVTVCYGWSGIMS